MPAQDTLNTLQSIEKLGVKVLYQNHNTEIIIDSPGIHKWNCKDEVMDRGEGESSGEIKRKKIYLGNSGTAARLLLGLFAGMENSSITLDGDASLCSRPMDRICSPLEKFGAKFQNNQYLPIQVYGQKLKDISFLETLGSAQVKSALILAGIASGVKICIREEKKSRNHTEIMLKQYKLNIKTKNNTIQLYPPYKFHNINNIGILGDPSSAAFFVVLSLLSNRILVVKNIMMNPYRIQYLNILKKNGRQYYNQKEKKSILEKLMETS